MQRTPVSAPLIELPIRLQRDGQGAVLIETARGSVRHERWAIRVHIIRRPRPAIWKTPHSAAPGGHPWFSPLALVNVVKYVPSSVTVAAAAEPADTATAQTARQQDQCFPHWIASPSSKRETRSA